MLVRAVNSALAQTFTDFELIIVDDGSTDDTPQVVGSLRDPRIRSLRHALSRGPAAARNTGISNARGEYIAFLDDDDEYLPTNIERQAQALDSAGPDVGLAYVWCSILDPTGEVIGARCPTAEGDVFDKALEIRLILGIGSSSMIRASVINDIGCFDEALLRREDLDFLCKLARSYKLVVIPEILVKLYKGHPQLSAPSRNTSVHLRDHILMHIAKFSDELKTRRHVRSALWRRLAVAEFIISNYGGGLRAGVVAFLTDPTTAYLAAKWLGRTAFGKIFKRK